LILGTPRSLTSTKELIPVVKFLERIKQESLSSSLKHEEMGVVSPDFSCPPIFPKELIPVVSSFRELSRSLSFPVSQTEKYVLCPPIFPKYSITKVVGILKAVSAREIRKEFPEVKDELWGGEFWEDGYFARTVGDQVTTEVIRQYIRFHEDRAKRPEQLRLI